MSNIYNLIYNNLNRLTGDVDDFMNGKGYLKLKSAGFMDLIIEKIAPDQISITHYYEQNGDLVPDPDVTVRIFPEIKQAEALTFQNCFVYRQMVL